MTDTNDRRLEPQPHGGALRRWPKGESGFPTKGRPAAGLSVIEWMNQMHQMTEDELQAVIDDRDQPKLKRAAARSLMRADADGYFNASPLAANDLDRIMDRTAGKPTQRVEITRDEPDPAAVLVKIQAILQRRPDLAQRVAGALPREIVAEVLPVDAEESRET